MKNVKDSLKLGIGLLISAGFMFLAFRKLNFEQMKTAFSVANYWLIIPTVLVIFASHWFRSLRQKYLLNPILEIDLKTLFSALLIGYSANTILPAHLGEFVRAYVIGKKKDISASSAMATIVVERILDLLSIALIMAFTLVIYPFPSWVKKSGYIMFGFAIGLFAFLIFMRIHTEIAMRFIRIMTTPLPHKFSVKIEEISRSFISGLQKMKHKRDYFIVFIHSILIWACYWGVMYINLYTFNLVVDYNVNAVTALVLLVITTISVVVPSSPGYIGTYHWLCQLSLELFGVPRAIGLSFAIVVHALSIFPVFLLGIVFAWREGIHLSKVEVDQGMIRTSEAL